MGVGHLRKNSFGHFISLTKPISPIGLKLKEASQRQTFFRNIEDVEIWMAEVEAQLSSEDYGKVSHLVIPRCWRTCPLILSTGSPLTLVKPSISLIFNVCHWKIYV